MPDAASDNAACDKYADYLLSTHVSSDSKFPPKLWVSTPGNSRRMNNATEVFHSQYNAQFYSAHLIYMYIGFYWHAQQATPQVTANSMSRGSEIYRNFTLFQWGFF